MLKPGAKSGWKVEVRKGIDDPPLQSVTVKAEHWMDALAQGRAKFAEVAQVPPGANCTIEASGRVVIQDPQTRRVYTITPTDAQSRTNIANANLASARLSAATKQPAFQTRGSQKPASTSLQPSSSVSTPGKDIEASKTVLSTKEHHANELNPLHYRERSIAVSDAITATQTETLLKKEWLMLCSTLENATPGKLIRVALFVRNNQSKLSSSPVAVLEWKDWVGAPTLTHYPAATQRMLGSLMPPVMSQTPPAPSIAPTAPLAAAAPSVRPGATQASPSVQPSPSPEPAQTLQQGTASVSISAPAKGAATISVPAAAVQPSVEAAGSEVQAPGSEVQAPGSEVQAPDPPANTDPQESWTAGSKPPTDELGLLGERPPKNLGVTEDRPTKELGVAAARPQSVIEEGDALGLVFEAFQHLYHIGTSREALRYALEVLKKAIPHEAAKGEVYDINAHCLRALAAQGTEIESREHPVDRGFAKIVCDGVEPVVIVTDFAHDPAFDAEVDQPAGVEVKNALFARISQGRHLLGMLSLYNRQNGAFTTQDKHVIGYVATQLHGFLRMRRYSSGPYRTVS